MIPPSAHGDPGGGRLHRAPGAERKAHLLARGAAHRGRQRAMTEKTCAKPGKPRAGHEKRGFAQRTGRDDGGEGGNARKRAQRRHVDRIAAVQQHARGDGETDEPAKAPARRSAAWVIATDRSSTCPP